MNATSYTISDIKELNYRNLISNCAKEISSQSVEVKSIYIIGSSVEKLIFSSPIINKDIDFAVIPKNDFVRGEIIFTNRELEKISRSIFFNYKEIGISYNGIPVIYTSGIEVDIIPIKPTDIENNYPQVKIDILSMSNIHIWGDEIFKNMMNPSITYFDITKRLKITEDYIKRELPKKPDYFIKYIEKSFHYSMILFFKNIPIYPHQKLHNILSKLNENMLYGNIFIETINKAISAKDSLNINMLFECYMKFNSLLVDNMHNIYKKNG